MIRLLPPVLVLAAACPIQAGDQKLAKAADYYPLQVGNAWHYRLDVTADGKPKQSLKAVSRIVGLEKDGKNDLYKLESMLEDKVVSTEQLSKSSKGVFRVRLDGKVSDPPFPLLPEPIKLGGKWDGSLRLNSARVDFTNVARQEFVDVPAGEFQAFRVDVDLLEQGSRITASYWFAEDVGIVKQTIIAGPVSVTLFLERFEQKN